MTVLEFLNVLMLNTNTVSFAQTIAVIEDHYDYTPTAFTNGELHNPAGVNEGACRIFAFARMHHLSEAQTLNCFGDYYRQDVLRSPTGMDHGNIRNFMKTGWSCVEFMGIPLVEKEVVQELV
jgi:HopJ type III effector protein